MPDIPVPSCNVDAIDHTPVSVYWPIPPGESVRVAEVNAVQDPPLAGHPRTTHTLAQPTPTPTPCTMAPYSTRLTVTAC